MVYVGDITQLLKKLKNMNYIWLIFTIAWFLISIVTFCMGNIGIGFMWLFLATGSLYGYLVRTWEK